MARLRRTSGDTATGAPRAATYQRSPTLSITWHLTSYLYGQKRRPLQKAAGSTACLPVDRMLIGSWSVSDRWRIGSVRPRERPIGANCALLMRVVVVRRHTCRSV